MQGSQGRGLVDQAKWAILLLVCSGGALFYFGYRAPRPVHPLKQPAALPSILESANLSFGLAANRRGDRLVVSWQAESPAIVSAVTGILVIQTGEDLQNFVLGPRELREGRFLYQSTADQIHVRLHVFDRNDRQANDSAVLSLAPDADRQSASRLGPSTAEGPKKAAGATDGKRVRNQPRAFSQTSLTSVSGAHEVLLATPPLVQPPPVPVATAARNWLEPPGARPFLKEVPGIAPVVTSSPLRPRNDRFVPPTPILTPSSELPADVSSAVRHAVSIDVKVFVSATGDVRYAELLSNGTGRDREIASFAVFDSRRWKFDPARLKGQSVEGEVVLHYRFSPASGLGALRSVE